MTNLEFDILQAIHNQPFQEAHRKILFTLENYQIDKIKSTIDDLLELKLIKQVPLSNCYKLSDSGLKVLRLAKKERENESKQKSQQRFNKKVAIAGLLVPFVIFILGLFSKYIVSFIFSLFK